MKRNIRKISIGKNVDNRIKKLKNRENIYQTTYSSNSVLELKEDKLETSLEAQVFQLAKQGISIEEIAKKLNRGKTEIELMIKLHKKQ